MFCPLPGVQTFKMWVSTDSNVSQSFRLSIGARDNILTPDIARHGVQVRESAPSYLRFNFPKEDPRQRFVVKITNSSLATCTIVSLQEVHQSPQIFFDEESNVRFNSSYLTMLEKAAIIVRKEQFPQGFYLILLGKSDKAGCYKKHSPTTEELDNLNMNVTVIIESLQTGLITGDIIIDSIISVLTFYVIILGVFYAFNSLLDRYFGFELDGKYGRIETLTRKHRESIEIEQNKEDNTDVVDKGHMTNEIKPEKTPIRFRPPFWFYTQDEWHGNGEHELQPVNETSENILEDTTGSDGVDNANNSSLRSWVSLVRQPILPKKIQNPSDDKFRTLDHNCKTLKDIHRQQLRTNQFAWITAIAGIFYALPAFQLVFDHQNPHILGGDLDICYYNFFCIFPFGPFADFGHFFSNIGYCIAGLSFNIKVYLRHRKFKRISDDLEAGIPEQVGIFYALGGALILEGILSSIHHICPTSSNFQFDTTFMYLIAVLVFLKLYQFRHVDFVLTAQLVFLLIGVCLTLETVGYFTSHWAFWLFFISLYIIFMSLFVIKIYLDVKSFKKLFRTICMDTRPNISGMNPLPCMFVIIINIFMAIFFGVKRVPGVSRYLLLILMGNMLLYEMWYVYNKMSLR